MRIPEAYECVETEHLPECNSEATVLRHRKTGARIFVLENDDENKVFTIGFRTPPADSTGLPHILEHSVLCGSEKYPVKDPFIELEKSSLRTFLNAMTYPDKTIYPVASCNEKDFQNLMDVYMDAVLHPAIYREEKILRQEGWHCEMETARSPLTINGVVYNEMKGAFSSPEDVLDRYTQAVLYPDTPYAFESGGDPDVIPTLTYADFLHFHENYYHPSNSFIYLYGNLDMEAKLVWLDEEYLGRYDFRDVDSRIARQAPFDSPAEAEIPYPISPEEDPAGKSYLSLHWSVGDITDPELYVAFQALETVLLTAPGAPVTQALADVGLGEDVYGGYQNAGAQPWFSIVAKNADESRREEFLSIVDRVLREQAEQGISRKSLEAALNSLEFRCREADFGPYPRGLMFGITSFDSWLYDSSPLTHLRYGRTFGKLRERLDSGYFEDLLRTYFLDNPHRAVLTLTPVPGLTERRDAELASKLAAYRDSLPGPQIGRIVRETAELKAYQGSPSRPEQLATLPTLTLADISPTVGELNNHGKKIGDIPVMHHEMFTSDILYLRVMFRADRVQKEDIPYLGLLRSLLPLLPTENYSYSELFSEISLATGGIGVGISVFQSVEDPDEFSPYIQITGRMFGDKLPRALELMQEILLRTNFRDEKRLKELAVQLKSRVLTQLQTEGHSTAMLRSSSYDSPVSWFNDAVGGIGYNDFLTGIVEQTESPEGMAALMDRLEGLAASVFVRDGMVADLTADREAFGKLEAAFGPFAEGIPSAEGTKADGVSSGSAGNAGEFRQSRASWDIVPEKKNEGFRTPAQIQYVACSGNFRKAGQEYSGALRVLRSILGNEYLWVNVRVKGGAYGCMCNFGRSGNGYFVSYRDPNLGATLDVYRGIVDYLRNFDIPETDMTNYIIGTIADMDRPMNPCEAGSFSLQCFMNGVSQEMRQRDRDEVLACTAEDIRRLADVVQAILDAGQICVVGNAGRLEAEKELFGSLVSLQ